MAAFSGTGERLTHIGVDLVEAGTKKSFGSQFHGAVAAKIPYGTYTLRVSAPGFRSHYRELRLDQPEVSIRSQLSVSLECGGYAEIRGSVRPAAKNRELWVKAAPVRGAGGAEAPVGQDGSFLIRGLDDGQYFLLIADGNTVVHVQTLQLLGSVQLTLTLDGK
ncbi:MAG: hypothetical protein IT580_14575 [Verrucomicrobiales bacterium]|nr:hypothetical protein [Verrucomicrobiales bacterium]